MSDTDDLDASNKFYNELHNVVRRWQKEGDLSMFVVIGALEAVKSDTMDALAKHNRASKDE